MKDPQQELDDELQFHIDQRIRDYIAKGMTPEAARAAATQRVGSSREGLRQAFHRPARLPSIAFPAD